MSEPRSLHTSADESGASRTLGAAGLRKSTIYDAAAGRIGTNGFLRTAARVSRSRDTASSSSVPLPPDEALFKRKRAPDRFEEADVYSAADDLHNRLALPASDLMKALHAYSSDYFALTGSRKSRGAWHSMDETALLALGVLIEEVASSILGETGELAFVEGLESAGMKSPWAWDGARWVRSVIARTPASGRE